MLFLKLLLLVAAAGLVTSTAYLLLVMIASARFRRDQRRETKADGACPPVTLLKPVCGMEPDLEANLTSFFQQQYPSFEIIFGARHIDDPALEVARRISSKFPAAVHTRVGTGVLRSDSRPPARALRRPQRLAHHAAADVRRGHCRHVRRARGGPSHAGHQHNNRSRLSRHAANPPARRPRLRERRQGGWSAGRHRQSDTRAPVVAQPARRRPQLSGGLRPSADPAGSGRGARFEDPLHERGHAAALLPAVLAGVPGRHRLPRGGNGRRRRLSDERVRQTLVSADPDFRTYGVRRLSDSLDASFWQARFELWVLGILGALALVLAAVGMYGVLAYHVTARTREIGIRVALGARPPDVVRLVIAQGLRVTAAGVAIGLLISALASRLLATLLQGVSPTDAVTWSAAVAVWIAMALVACWLPARRAARVEAPVRSLASPDAVPILIGRLQ